MRKLVLAILLFAAPAFAGLIDEPQEQRCIDLDVLYDNGCACSEPLNYSAAPTTAGYINPPDSEGSGSKGCYDAPGGNQNNAIQNASGTVEMVRGNTVGLPQIEYVFQWEAIGGGRVHHNENVGSLTDKTICSRVYFTEDTPTTHFPISLGDDDLKGLALDSGGGWTPDLGCNLVKSRCYYHVDDAGGPRSRLWDYSNTQSERVLSYSGTNLGDACSGGEWCRTEGCIDHNAFGNDRINVRARTVRISDDATQEFTPLLSVNTNSSASGSFNRNWIWRGQCDRGGSQDGACNNKSRWISHAMQAIIPVDKDFWIGPASEIEDAGPTPTPTATPSASPTPTVTATPTATITASPTATPSATATPTPNPEIPCNGELLFSEDFDDDSFAARGWYDSPDGDISEIEYAPGSTSSFECIFAAEAQSCAGGTPNRYELIPDTDSLYLSFWIKFSDNWIGSGQTYHPHMFRWFTNIDGDYVGPASSHLSVSAEIVDDSARINVTDNLNVDNDCILKSNETVPPPDDFRPGGYCQPSGVFATWVADPGFTEERSVASCNGRPGEPDYFECYWNDGPDYWYSSRGWWTEGAFVDDSESDYYKGDWHFVEVYVEMNTIDGGIGQVDGKIRWVQDGETLFTSDEILFRTGEYESPALLWDQFLMSGYMAPPGGSPIEQTYWMDDMTVATARLGTCGASPTPTPTATPTATPTSTPTPTATPTADPSEPTGLIGMNWRVPR